MAVTAGMRVVTGKWDRNALLDHIGTTLPNALVVADEVIIPK